MIRSRLAVFLGVTAVVALLTVNSAGATRNAVLWTRMTGAAERPTPVNTPGVGTAVVNVDADNQRICVSYNFGRLLAPAIDGHIHEGSSAVAGPVRIPFPGVPPQTGGSASFCTTPGSGTWRLAPGDTPAALLDRLTETPQNFYVNIHSSLFPGGEIRGQLVLAASSPTSTIAAP